MTSSSKPALFIAGRVRDKGIDAIMALFYGSNIVNKNSALERLKKEKIEKIAGYDPGSNPILQEYARLQIEAGIPDPMPPARHLIELIKANRRMPNINTVVDSYKSRFRGDVPLYRGTRLGSNHRRRSVRNYYRERVLCTAWSAG